MCCLIRGCIKSLYFDQDENSDEETGRPKTSNVASPPAGKMRPASLSFVKVRSVSNDVKLKTPSTGDELPTEVTAEDEVDVAVEEEIVLRIVRPPGTGLGISIAGGAGTTPYRDNDEVLRFVVPQRLYLRLTLSA
jgi:hypothetical protein